MSGIDILKEEALSEKKTKAKRRELYVPRGAQNEEQTLLISVNGQNFVLPRGKTSLVPEVVKAEYERAERAKERLEKKRDALLNAAREGL